MPKYKELTQADEIRALKRMIILMAHAIDVPENIKPPLGFVEYIKEELRNVGTVQYKLLDPMKERNEQTKGKELF